MERGGRPSGRAARTEAAILDTAARLAADEGWAGLTPGHVAEASGLSRPTVLRRYADRASLGAALWRHRCAASLHESMEALLATIEDESAEKLHNGLEPFLNPDERMSAALELLVVAGYVPSILHAIDDTLGRALTAWTSPDSRAGSRIKSAQRAFVIALAIGCVLETRRRGGLDADPATGIEEIAAALQAPGKPVRLPSARADHLDQPVPFDTGEQVWNAVLHATLDCVGDVGYEAATVELIAATAGYTKGVIFSRYASKHDLFLDASDRMLELTGPLNVAYQHEIAQRHSSGVAAACFVRESTRPEHRRIRTILLEQVRLASHDPRLQSAFREAVAAFEQSLAAEQPDLDLGAVRGRIMLEIAFTTGLSALAQIRPEIWHLPFDAVVVPWRDIRDQHL